MAAAYLICIQVILCHQDTEEAGMKCDQRIDRHLLTSSGRTQVLWFKPLPNRLLLKYYRLSEQEHIYCHDHDDDDQEQLRPTEWLIINGYDHWKKSYQCRRKPISRSWWWWWWRILACEANVCKRSIDNNNNKGSVSNTTCWRSSAAS